MVTPGATLKVVNLTISVGDDGTVSGSASLPRIGFGFATRRVTRQVSARHFWIKRMRACRQSWRAALLSMPFTHPSQTACRLTRQPRMCGRRTFNTAHGLFTLQRRAENPSFILRSSEPLPRRQQPDALADYLEANSKQLLGLIAEWEGQFGTVLPPDFPRGPTPHAESSQAT
jgi:hypothetical protein